MNKTTSTRTTKLTTKEPIYKQNLNETYNSYINIYIPVDSTKEERKCEGNKTRFNFQILFKTEFTK